MTGNSPTDWGKPVGSKEKKDAFRRQTLAWRRSLEPEEAEALSAKLCDRLTELLEEPWAKEMPVLAYAAVRGEADLSACCGRLLEDGRKLYLPRVRGEQMDFVRVRDPGEDLIPGAFGVPEPVGEEVFCGKRALALIPGVVFDAAGARAGYGRGYYDRYLADRTGIVKIGICYQGQICGRLPADPWDIYMDAIVTEQSVYQMERRALWN